MAIGGYTNNLSLDIPQPMISGFWKRFLAFMVDVVILSLIGLILGIFFFDVFARMGAWGRLLGFSISLLYFGILNSHIGDGQTIGKHVFNIQVVDERCKVIPVSISFTRHLILGAPFFLNSKFLLSEFINHPTIVIIAGILILFFSGATIYLFVFNRGTRQSLHDLITGTYIVEKGTGGSRITHSIWKGHWVSVAVLFLLSAASMTFIIPGLIDKTILSELVVVKKHIEASGIVHMATVLAGKQYKSVIGTDGVATSEFTYLNAEALLRQSPFDFDDAATRVAAILFETYPKSAKKDKISINLLYGYDIGIASAWKNKLIQHTPQEWEALICISELEREGVDSPNLNPFK